jgi:hypothetical protein
VPLAPAALVAACAFLAGCAGFTLPGMASPSEASEQVPAATTAAQPPAAVPAPPEPAAAPGVAPAPQGDAARSPDPVEEAEALVAGDQLDAAMALLKRTLADGTAPAEDALYWIAVLSFSPPISDPARGRAAVDRLLAEFPDGKRRHEAAALKSLMDETDRLTADNATLKGDLQKLLNIDVEAQRQRRGSGTAPAPAPEAPAAP